jgi:hypothetical protein
MFVPSRNRSVIPTGAYPDFLPRRSEQAAYVPFRKEGRMKCTEAFKFNRKSGGAQWRDLLFHSTRHQSSARFLIH